MTTTYKFKAAYKKLGLGYVPIPAPTCTVVDSADNVLANAQAITALANLPGVCLYSYTGADGLDVIGLFHTDDTTVDEQDLHSYTPDILTTNLNAPVATIDTVVDAIKVVTDKLDSVQAEPTGAPAANATPMQKIAYLFMALRNKITITAAAKNIHDDAGNVEWSKSLSDNGTTYTEEEAA